MYFAFYQIINEVWRKTDVCCGQYIKCNVLKEPNCLKICQNNSKEEKIKSKQKNIHPFSLNPLQKSFSEDTQLRKRRHYEMNSNIISSIQKPRKLFNSLTNRQSFEWKTF